MGGGTCFGMPTPELEAVSAPSWGTGLRPLFDLAPVLLKSKVYRKCVENPVIDL